VDIRDPDGRLIARGLTEYSSTAIRLLKGLQSRRIRELLGSAAPGELIHRDNLVLNP